MLERIGVPPANTTAIPDRFEWAHISVAGVPPYARGRWCILAAQTRHSADDGERWPLPLVMFIDEAGESVGARQYLGRIRRHGGDRYRTVAFVPQAASALPYVRATARRRRCRHGPAFPPRAALRLGLADLGGLHAKPAADPPAPAVRQRPAFPDEHGAARCRHPPAGDLPGLAADIRHLARTATRRVGRWSHHLRACLPP